MIPTMRIKAVGTVTRAYKEAEERGLLAGEVGRGSYIRRPRERAHGQLIIHQQDFESRCSRHYATSRASAEHKVSTALGILFKCN